MTAGEMNTVPWKGGPVETGGSVSSSSPFPSSRSSPRGKQEARRGLPPAQNRPPHGLGDGLRQRGLPDPGRAEETENGTRASRVALARGQVLDDPRLRVLEPRLSGIQHPPDALQVDPGVVALRPREILQPLDPGARRGSAAARIGGIPHPFGLNGLPHSQGQRVDRAIPQERGDETRRDHVRPLGLRRPAERDLTTDLGEASLQVLHARFTGVVPNHPADRLWLEADVAPGRGRAPRLARAVPLRRRARRQRSQLLDGRNDPIGDHGRTGHGHDRTRERRGGSRRRGRGRGLEHQDARRRRQRVVERTLQQMLLRNRQLLLLGVRRQVDDVQAVPHLRGNRPGVGRRRDPQNPGEIKRDSEVHVHERRALRRVEDAEQRVGILVSVACLVDPLEDEDRVVHLGVAQAVDHAAGGAAIRPHNLMLGRLAVEGHAHGLPAEGLRDRVRERCLAGPPGTGKAEDRGPSPSPSRANDEGGQGVRLRATARARPLEGEQVARLGTRPQELKDAGWTPSRAAWVRRRTCATCSVSNRWGSDYRPRQVEQHPNPIKLRLGRLGSRTQRVGHSVGQRLVNSTGHTGTIERPDKAETTSGERPGNSSAALSGLTTASWSRSSARASSTGTARPDTVKSGRPHRWRCCAVVIT